MIVLVERQKEELDDVLLALWVHGLTTGDFHALPPTQGQKVTHLGLLSTDKTNIHLWPSPSMTEPSHSSERFCQASHMGPL